MKDFLAKFSSPDTKYRGRPFWAWNAKLDKDELVRQIRSHRGFSILSPQWEHGETVK